jgi:hypothetical protein
VEVSVLALSVCKAGSQFHLSYFSRDPPIIPDGRVTPYVLEHTEHIRCGKLSRPVLRGPGPRWGPATRSYRRRPAPPREHDFRGFISRLQPFRYVQASESLPSRSFRPLQISLQGRPTLLRPSRTCVVTSARIEYAICLTRGKRRNEDLHLARFSALSPAPYPMNSTLQNEN